MFEVNVIWKRNGMSYDTVLSFSDEMENELLNDWSPDDFIGEAIAKEFGPEFENEDGYEVHEIYSYDLRKFFI